MPSAWRIRASLAANSGLVPALRRAWRTKTNSSKSKPVANAATTAMSDFLGLTGRSGSVAGYTMSLGCRPASWASRVWMVTKRAELEASSTA